MNEDQYEIELLHREIEELKAENQRMLEALKNVKIYSSNDSAAYELADKALTPPGK